jgi:hypothetical protein
MSRDAVGIGNRFYFNIILGRRCDSGGVGVSSRLPQFLQPLKRIKWNIWKLLITLDFKSVEIPTR